MIIDPNKFSNLKRLVHVTAWVQRFLTNCRLPMNLRRKDRILLPTEISEAKTFWIKQTYNPRKRWHCVQQLLGQFWKRWRKEFLPSLNVTKKWFHPRHNLKEGDVVLIVEPNANRREWPLGCVIEAYPGDDGLVRVVKVKVKNKEYFRPVHHLCPLEYVEDRGEE